MKTPLPPPHGRADGDCDCLPRPTDFNPNSDPGPPLTTFVLRYQDAWFGVEKRVAFEAADVAAALTMMAREPVGAWAELLHDGAVVCRRGNEPGGAPDYWVVD